jgi:hypothetical protein
MRNFMRGCKLLIEYNGVGISLHRVDVCYGTHICRRLQVGGVMSSIKPAVDRRSALIAPSVILMRR